MKERPILFSASMVKAILAGRKTQTRRIMRPQPEQLMLKDADGVERLHWCIDHSNPKKRAAWPVGDPPFWTNGAYGKAGDRLWVKETWGVVNSLDYLKPSKLPTGIPVTYRASSFHPNDPSMKWRPGMFMPRWASRITLEIRDVRIQRLQDITEDDAKAEGAPMGYTGPYSFHQRFNHWGGFMALWSSINDEGSWDANPFVWVIAFDLVQP